LRGVQEDSAGFLAIDIGNTHITTGYFFHEDLETTLKMPSSSDPHAYWHQIEAWLGTDRFASIEGVGMSSVVENLETKISDAFATTPAASKRNPPRVSIIARGFAFPLKSVYEPGHLGTDRMLAAVAGAAIFGKPVITVDIGSAVTIDLVGGDGVFRGGLILAGGGFRVRALATFTSLLPEIPVPQSPPPLIGTSTVACLSSGIYHGMRAEIQGLVVQIQQEIGVSTPVVLTGQGSRLFQQSLPDGWQIEEWLVLKGIYYTCRESGAKSRES
jgi:type III pantothenate kinase